MNIQITSAGNSNIEFTDPGLTGVQYVYKTKNKKERRAPCYFIQPDENTLTTSQAGRNYASGGRLTLHQNQTDDSRTFVVIKFYLPKSAEAKLILMDSEKTEVLNLFDKELEAGSHTIVTEIRNEELSRFNYFYKLEADGHSEVRQMKYVN